MKKAIRLILLTLSLCMVTTACSLIENITGNGNSNNTTAQTASVTEAPTAPVVLTGHTEKEEKYYENDFFAMGCSLDDSWTVEKVQYNYIPKEIADATGAKSGPDGSIPLVYGYDLDFYATRPGDVIIVYVKNKSNMENYQSEADVLVKNEVAASENDTEKINFLGGLHASKVISYEEDHIGFQRFIAIEKDNQYMVIDLIASFQDTTDDLLKYFYIPGQTTVADEVKHPVSDGTVLMCVPGYHDFYKLEASSTHSAKGYKFSVDALSDADYTTAWCGDVGVNDCLTYEFDDVVSIRKLIMVNGNVKDEASFNAYGRVKKVRIEYDDGYIETEVEPISYYQFVDQGAANILDFQKIIKTKTLKIIVLETTAGNANALPCISDIILGVKLKAYVTNESTGEKTYMGAGGLRLGNSDTDEIKLDDKSINGNALHIFFSEDIPCVLTALNPPAITVDGRKLFGMEKQALSNGSKIKIEKAKFVFGVESASGDD